MVCTMVFLLLAFPVTVLSAAATRESCTKVLAETNSGTIEGRVKMVGDTEVEVYLAVPYAEPPVGHRRFRKPSNVKPWSGVTDAKAFRYSCMQGSSPPQLQYPADLRWEPNTPESEDCLTLNIWSPRNKPDNATVMVYIYGGSFVRGTSTIDMFNGATLAAYGQVIVVTFNYRVGALGFLYLDDDAAPGNQGLWDQKMAIEWVRDNIRHFGGDQSSVTLFGQSAGGMSTSLHLLSPETRTLFQRAIVQSGTVNSPVSTLTAAQAKYFAWQLIKEAGCEKTGTLESINCLKSLDAKLLSQLQLKLYQGATLAFVPTIDGVFLPADPLSMLTSGQYGEQDILIGNVQNEGTYILAGDPQRIFNDQTVIPLPRAALHSLYDAFGADLSANQRLTMKYEYTDWESDISFNNQLLLADAIGDRIFLCPSVRFAKEFSKKNLAYYYYFTQRTSSILWGEWMGVVHRAELEYVFGLPRDIRRNYTIEERYLSAKIMYYFTDFAKYGNPTPNGKWPIYTEASQVYMELNADQKGTGIGPRAQQCALWNYIVPSMSC